MRLTCVWLGLGGVIDGDGGWGWQLRLETVEAVIAAGFHLQVARGGVVVDEQVIEVKVRRPGGTHLRYDKKFELYLGGVEKAGVAELMEKLCASVDGAREATVEMHMWGGAAYWKLTDEDTMMRFAALDSYEGCCLQADTGG